VRELDRNMEVMAAAEGLEYHLTEKGQTGNTLDAHRLVHLAAGHKREHQMLDRLYKAYFTEERSVFDVESLVGLAVDEGLDATEVREALESNQYVDAVKRDLDEARMLGVSGVPFSSSSTAATAYRERRPPTCSAVRSRWPLRPERRGSTRQDPTYIYSGSQTHVLELHVPAPYWRAMLPFVCLVSLTSTIFIPLISTVSFVPLAVMSMVFHFPPVMMTLAGLATSTMAPVR
jgi:hypothetical protein